MPPRATAPTDPNTPGQPTWAVNVLPTLTTLGEAHLTSRNGDVPDQAQHWGWRVAHSRNTALPLGTHIGWTDGALAWLDPKATYRLLTRNALRTGHEMASKRAVGAALAGAGLITVTQASHGREFRARRNVGGRWQDVWEMPADWVRAELGPMNPDAILQLTELPGAKPKRSVSKPRRQTYIFPNPASYRKPVISEPVRVPAPPPHQAPKAHDVDSG